MNIMRVGRALAALPCFVLIACASACGGDDTAPPDGGLDGGGGTMDGGVDAPVSTDAGPPYDAHYEGPRVTEAEAEPMRASCAFERGAMPWETLGSEYPIGDDIPIEHIIMLMQENRSFDHYFGTMPGVDGIPPGASNPNAAGDPVEPFHTTEYCIEDVGHGWNPSHREWNDGANDGFVTANDPDGERALGYLDGSDLPFYWDLYSRFAMSDHHHCSLLGPTWVNRIFYMAGTSFGLTRNTPIPMDRLVEPYVIFNLLDERGLDWRIYNPGLPFALGGFPDVISRNFDRLASIDQLHADLAAGTLPPVSYVDPAFAGANQSDEHPPANIQVGQAFVRDIVEAVMASPLWDRTVLIITYDEHGGFYDHVPPPEACPPGDYPPELEPGDDPGDFDRYGFRVPLVVVSPYSRAGYVSDRVTDHGSILRFVETRFLMPALTARDANAWPLMDMFDFDAPPFMTPPTESRGRGHRRDEGGPMRRAVPRRRRALIALLGVLASACATEMEPPAWDGHEPFIALPRDFEGFEAWQRFLIPDIGTSVGHEPGEPRLVYVNGPVPPWGERFPVGFILVKTLENRPAHRVGGPRDGQARRWVQRRGGRRMGVVRPTADRGPRARRRLARGGERLRSRWVHHDRRYDGRL